MKKNDNAIITVEEVLRAASSYNMISSKSMQLDNEIHRKLKRILVDYDYDNVTMQKLINIILHQWIQLHKSELNKKLLSKIGWEY